MRFVNFVKSLETDDKSVRSFISFVNRNKRFPLSSDPDLFFFYLRDKLNDMQIDGYMKCMIMYSEHPRNMLPKRLKDKNLFHESVNRMIMYKMQAETEAIIEELESIETGSKQNILFITSAFLLLMFLWAKPIVMFSFGLMPLAET